MLDRSKKQGSGTVFNAWTSGILSRMINNLETPGHPIDVHYLLLCIVEATYKKRKESAEMRDLCEIISFRHLALFPAIAPYIIEKDFIPRVPTFQLLATLLSEKGEFEKAIAVCRMALMYDLHDNTKSGFEGRIGRIRKKMHHPRASDDFMVLLKRDFERGLQYRIASKSQNNYISDSTAANERNGPRNSGCAAILICVGFLILLLHTSHCSL